MRFQSLLDYIEELDNTKYPKYKVKFDNMFLNKNKDIFNSKHANKYR